MTPNACTVVAMLSALAAACVEEEIVVPVDARANLPDTGAFTGAVEILGSNGRTFDTYYERMVSVRKLGLAEGASVRIAFYDVPSCEAPVDSFSLLTSLPPAARRDGITGFLIEWNDRNGRRQMLVDQMDAQFSATPRPPDDPDQPWQPPPPLTTMVGRVLALESNETPLGDPPVRLACVVVEAAR